MTENYIRFKKQREVGEIITDTFRFLRENYRPLLHLIFRITGPVFLIVLLALTYYSYLTIDTLENPFLVINTGQGMTMVVISLFILLFSLLAFYVLLIGTILHFINSYILNEGTVNEQQVYQGVKNDFGSMLGLLLLGVMITGFGLMLCVFPGIYLWVPFAIAPASLVFARLPLMDAINHTFSLIKGNWWFTFFSLVVIVLLVYIIGLIFQAPMLIYFFFKSLTSSQAGSVADPSSMLDWVYVVFNVISSLAQYLLSSIIIIAIAFIYYNLDEKKNFTGSYEIISNLGSSDKS